MFKGKYKIERGKKKKKEIKKGNGINLLILVGVLYYDKER